MAEPDPAGRPADLAREGRIDVRPPAVELTAALLGDRGLLVPLSAWGEPQQLFWPRPDRDATLATFALGLVAKDGRSPVWLRDLQAEQHIEDDADIVRTRLVLDGRDGDGADAEPTPGAVTIEAMIDPTGEEGTAVLVLDVRGDGAGAGRALLVELALTFGDTDEDVALLVDPPGVLVAHRNDRALALAAARAGTFVACVIDPQRAHAATRAVRMIVPELESVTLLLALAPDPARAVEAARNAAPRGPTQVRDARRAADRARAAERTPTLVDGSLDVLDRVGLRALRALQAPEGGVLAAPESDPDRRRSGGYGFVWARDLAFIVTAAAVAGQRDVVDGALDWLVRAQSPDGLYEQRHWSDGRVAPGWGLQLDETGAVLHAIDAVARVLGEKAVVARCWPTVHAGAEVLTRLLDPATGLPPASLDVWEERIGVHTYTVAATIAGLEASARMADGRDDAAAQRWRAAALQCRAGLEAHLWSESHGRFVRSRDVARADAEGAPVPPRYQPPGRAPHAVRSVDRSDATVDASLLGLAYPFGILAHDDPRLAATVDAVERELTAGPGLRRYPGDTYVGGNPWLLTRLWLGLARRAPGSPRPAAGIAEVARCATDAMLLAEQVDEHTARSVWVVPLAWSHAFYALACRPDHRSAPDPQEGRAGA